VSRIDELQRLHEAASIDAFAEGSDAFAVAHANVMQTLLLRNSWPAIHRVLVAARKVSTTRRLSPEHLDANLELAEALRALDGGLPADQ
jgi:hypothetical protein